MLAVWEKDDPFFMPAGAEAFENHTADAAVRILNGRHFWLETKMAEMAGLISEFLKEKEL